MPDDITSSMPLRPTVDRREVSKLEACQAAIDAALDQARRENPDGRKKALLREAVKILAVRAIEAERVISKGYVRSPRVGSGGVR